MSRKSVPVSEKKPVVATLPTDSKWKYLVNCWIFIPALFYFITVNEYAVNIPAKDDYDAILNFILAFKASPFSHKIALLFSQHNEHRIFHSRVIYVLYYYLFGGVNFRNFVFIGDLQLVVIFLVSVYFIRKVGGKYWNVMAFIWGLCVFDLNTYENGEVAMTAIQNYGVVMLFFVSLFFYSLEKKKYLVPAALFQFICIFSSGNGMIASIFLVAYTLFGDSKIKKIVCISTAVICSALYFVGYVAPVDPNQGPFTLSIAIPYFIQMTGAPFDFDYSMLFGIVVLVLLAIVFPYKKIRINSPMMPVICIVCYMLATMCAAAFFRSNMKDAHFQASRYLLYPQLVIGALCLFLYLKLEGHKWRIPVMIVLVLIMLKEYSKNAEFGKAGFAREQYKMQNSVYYYPNPERAKMIADSACDLGIYCIQLER